MKIMQTLEGGLRIDVEDASDWMILQGITSDAVSCDENLSSRLGKLITDEEVAADWKEYIIPDLQDGFSSDLQHVTTAIATSQLECGGGPGSLWITPDDAMRWYSALNQARLAIEECYHFGPSENIRPAALPEVYRPPFMRSQFYCALQSMLLEFVLK
jgi:hypothetical protein